MLDWVGFLEPPSFVKAMEDKEVRVGEAIVLECMASGWPKPTLRWTKDGIHLPLTDRHFFTADDQLLIIMDTALSDSGLYVCEMTNSLGTNRGQAHLTILPGTKSSTTIKLLNIYLVEFGNRREHIVVN